MAKRLTENAGSNGPPVVDPETERDFIRKLVTSKQDVDVYVAIHRNVLKAAGKAGINTKKMLASIVVRKLNLPEVVQDEKDFIRYCAHQNMPITDVDLFGGDGQSAGEVADQQRSDDDNTWEAGQKGYEAGKAGRKIDECPFTTGSADDYEWRLQWLRGQNHLAMQSFGKPPVTTEASDRRERSSNGSGRAGRSKVVPEPARRAAGKLQPNTAADVHAAVAEDDHEEAEA